MAELTLLLLADPKPGHYHLADGIALALARVRPVKIIRQPTQRRTWLPGRVLEQMIRHKLAPDRILKLGFGLNPQDWSKIDVIISAGGQTLPANIAAARYLGCPNIFVGSLRRYNIADFALNITSYTKGATTDKHLVTLKPGKIDAEQLGRPVHVPRYGDDNPPARAGLLIGGNTTRFAYQPEDWQALMAGLKTLHEYWGTTWIISTSRRSPPEADQAIRALMAENNTVIERYIEYNTAGPGTLPELFGAVDMVLVTADSSSMISEAITARLPVIGVTPAQFGFSADETGYRAYLDGEHWQRTVAIADLNGASLSAQLAEIRPMAGNPVDRLAARIKEKLPQLFK